MWALAKALFFLLLALLLILSVATAAAWLYTLATDPPVRLVGVHKTEGETP